jgi:subtilisin-like proprotein convertase family protein
MVSGVTALLLEANPNLSWRDVRYIYAKTAKKTDPTNSDWSKNGAQLNINHNYGFGLVDASAAIQQALVWTNLPASIKIEKEQVVNIAIPDNDSVGIEQTIIVDETANVEFVDVYLNAADHPKVGDLVVTLTSPSGTKSILSELHNQVFGVFRYNNWRFGSLRHLGEPANGTWKLQIQDKRAGNTGTWASWKIKIHAY